MKETATSYAILSDFGSRSGRFRPIRAIRLADAKGNITPPDIAETNAAIA